MAWRQFKRGTWEAASVSGSFGKLDSKTGLNQTDLMGKRKEAGHYSGLI